MGEVISFAEERTKRGLLPYGGPVEVPTADDLTIVRRGRDVGLVMTRDGAAIASLGLTERLAWRLSFALDDAMRMAQSGGEVSPTEVQ